MRSTNFEPLVLVGALVLGLVSCEADAPAPPTAEPTADASDLAAPAVVAVEKFLETWNSRDPELWTSSLAFPHARPSAAGLRTWQTAAEYLAEVDFAAVIATGWDHTEFERLRPIHGGPSKAHIAGLWARKNAKGETIRRNSVTYIATEQDGSWKIQARFGAGAPLSDEAAGPIQAIALAKVEEYMRAFNARDPAAWAATLNYPHLRIASGALEVWESEEELAAGMDFDAFAAPSGWDHSAWDDIEAVQVSAHAANVALRFSRFNAAEEVISTFQTLYLVTNDRGRWGIMARSSFAP